MNIKKHFICGFILGLGILLPSNLWAQGPPGGGGMPDYSIGTISPKNGTSISGQNFSTKGVSLDCSAERKTLNVFYWGLKTAQLYRLKSDGTWQAVGNPMTDGHKDLPFLKEVHFTKSVKGGKFWPQSIYKAEFFFGYQRQPRGIFSHPESNGWVNFPLMIGSPMSTIFYVN